LWDSEILFNLQPKKGARSTFCEKEANAAQACQQEEKEGTLREEKEGGLFLKEPFIFQFIGEWLTRHWECRGKEFPARAGKGCILLGGSVTAAVGDGRPSDGGAKQIRIGRSWRKKQLNGPLLV